MSELRKKPRVIQIPVTETTYLNYQETFYKFAKVEKWKSKEDMLKTLLQLYNTNKELSKYK
jgi:hypothetical protein